MFFFISLFFLFASTFCAGETKKLSISVIPTLSLNEIQPINIFILCQMSGVSCGCGRNEYLGAVLRLNTKYIHLNKLPQDQSVRLLAPSFCSLCFLLKQRNLC